MTKVLLTSDTHYGMSSQRTARILDKFIKKIVSEEPDVVLHAGDWASTKQEQLKKGMAQFRRILGDEMPIVGVFGNHCLWNGDKNKRYTDIYDLLTDAKAVRTSYNIVDHYAKDNVEIFGYDSWYKTNCPPSNDHYWMPIGKFKYAQEMHQYLIEQSTLNCEAVCQKIQASTAKHKIVVTHFEAVGTYRGRLEYDGMKGSFVEYQKLCEAGATLICYGHSHRECDWINDYGVRIINCGSNYNIPQYKIIQIGEP